MSSPAPACIAIVTGANRLNGVGLSAVRGLAAKYPTSEFNRGPFLIYLTSRKADSGEAAVKAVTQQIQEAAIKDSPPVEVKLRLLDIESKDSITAFAAALKADHPDGIDILINNAGVVGITGPEGLKPEPLEWTMRCNYYGTLYMMDTLLPQIKEGGRIASLGSLAGSFSMGSHKMYSETIRQRFLDAETVEDVNKLVEDFAAAVAKGGEDWKKDWPASPYSVSKCAVVAITRVFAKKAADRKILVNVCCPGMVMTDMFTVPQAGMTAIFGEPKTPEGGAKTPVMLGIEDIKGQSGLFWRNEEVLGWK